jgi:hypothetical protein
VTAITIQAVFSEDDPAYGWIMTWLAVPERQSDARNFEVVSTKYPERLEEGGRDDGDGLALIPAFGELKIAARRRQ